MKVNHTAAAVASAVVLAVVVAGLYLGGSPAEQRIRRLDALRVADLQRLVQAVRWFQEQHGFIPEALGELTISGSSMRIPTDPESSEPYRYEVTSANSYRLCGVFAAPAVDPGPDGFWAHGAGEHCFDVDLGRALQAFPPESNRD